MKNRELESMIAITPMKDCSDFEDTDQVFGVEEMSVNQLA
jgi:hypothetical protein